MNRRMIHLAGASGSLRRQHCRLTLVRSHIFLLRRCTMRPAVSAEQAKDMAYRYWGLEMPLEVSELAGYDDRNWRVAGAPGAPGCEPLTTCPTLWGPPPPCRMPACLRAGPTAACVLKVHNATDSAKPLFAEAQNALLVQLEAAGIPVPAPLQVAADRPDEEARNLGGDPYTLRIVADDGRQHAVRALSWLPGKLLVDVAQVGGSCCLGSWRGWGASLCRIDRVHHCAHVALQSNRAAALPLKPLLCHGKMFNLPTPAHLPPSLRLSPWLAVL